IDGLSLDDDELNKPDLSQRPTIFIAFDIEAATDLTRSMPGFDSGRWDWRTQSLLFGIARIGQTSDMHVTDEIVFYPDDLPAHGLQIIKSYIEEHTVALEPRKAKAGESLYVVNLPEREKVTMTERRWRDEREVSVWLMSRSEFLKELYRVAYQKRGLIIGFNLP